MSILADFTHTRKKEMDFRRIPSGVGPTEKIHQPFGPL